MPPDPPAVHSVATAATLHDMHGVDTLIAAFALAPIGVTVTRDGITEHCNPAYLEMFGYAGHEHEIYGKPVTVMIAPEHRPAVLAQIESRRSGATVVASYDTWGLRRDGSVFPFHVAVRRILFGERPATLAFFMDLTERRRMEEDLRRARDELGALVEASPVPTMMLDTRGRVQIWNPAATDAFGWTREEALGRINPLIGSEHREEYARNVASALAGGLHGTPAQRRRKDGSPVDLEIYAAPTRDRDGVATGVMAITLDVTARKRTEEALRRSEEQLRHAQKMEAVGQLAGGVSHDFNNMLTVISALADLLESHVTKREPDPVRGAPGATVDDGEAPWSGAECIAELRRAIGRATALTRQLLAFSRRQVLTPRTVDLGAIVRDMGPMLRTLGGPDLRLVFEVAEDLAPTRADAGQMEQVIANLALNARDAMPGGGTITIRTRNAVLREGLSGDYFPVPPGDYVAVAVVDDGVGIESTLLGKIFEPFFTTKERGKGTGLGLSTVFGIVQQSGGHLRVTSAPGRGSTFEVFLPQAPAAESAPDHASAASDAPERAVTVVLAEDDPAIRRLTRTLLEQSGVTVREADNAEQALWLLAREGPSARSSC